MTPERILPRALVTFAVIEDARRSGLKAYLVSGRIVFAREKLGPGWCLISVPVSSGPEAA